LSNGSSYHPPVRGEEIENPVEDTEPRTEACPLNGALWGKTKQALWTKRRPLGIMVENSVDARPQSGLSNADVIFEAVAEGGVTRFLAIFYCQDAKIVGPVRSARVYFIDFLGGFGAYPLYAHVGGANTPGPADALGQIEDMEWAVYNDLNQFSIGFPTYWRDYERLPNVATEHTMYSTTEKLWSEGVKRGLTNVDKEGEAWDKDFAPWLFKEEAKKKSSQTSKISYGFWDSQKSFDVAWSYDAKANSYLRSNAGKKHLDKNTGEQLSVKNLVVAQMDESVARDGYDQGQHLLYGTKGEGPALIFQDGGVIEGRWQKKDRFSQIVFVNENDEEIKFNRGPIWISVIPTGNKVSYQ
jgi:hypothetical protein